MPNILGYLEWGCKISWGAKYPVTPGYLLEGFEPLEAIFGQLGDALDAQMEAADAQAEAAEEARRAAESDDEHVQRK